MYQNCRMLPSYVCLRFKKVVLHECFYLWAHTQRA